MNEETRASLNLPPTYEEQMARQAQAAFGGKTRMQRVSQGARSVLRWVQIVRAGMALVFGVGLLVGGLWLLAEAPSGGRKNALEVTAIGVFLVGISGWYLRRAFRKG